MQHKYLFPVSYFTCVQNGFSPVYIASENGHTEVVDLLVQAGADIHLATTEEVHVGRVLGLDGSVTILFHELLSGNMICYVCTCTSLIQTRTLVIVCIAFASISSWTTLPSTSMPRLR